jgi:hypothetical protein
LTVAKHLKNKIMKRSRFAEFHALFLLAFTTFLPSALHAQQTITGQAAFADYTQQKPGPAKDHCGRPARAETV